MIRKPNMSLLRTLAVITALVAAPALAQAPSNLSPVPAPRAEAPSGPLAASAPARAGTTLTATDLNGWLDGFMPYALNTGDIAGAVVVVVKDGQVLTQRGYGYADMATRRPVDPERTLFRPGSVSKLFTWTAVMQLVQSGQLDLDRDINDYLDFRIPPAFGKPITLRHLMTHTAGFEEAIKYLIITDPEQMMPLDDLLRRWTPTRVNAPGAVPAYSNYGASLAGYIVERVSGQPFDLYVRDHIMVPTGMMHSTFAQPLPASFTNDMSKGYAVASQEPRPFELVALAPAGALTATGADMARFMIAHLDNGGPLLNPQTAAQMYGAANTPIPGLPGMALGFYQENRNGRRIIGHAGDTNWFHSDLHLYLDEGVGLYVSFNSGGRAGAAHTAREQLFNSFTDRYFPGNAAPLATTATARDHGAAMVGHYVSSRGSKSNWVKMIELFSPTQIVQNEDGTITVSSLRNAGGALKKWREVGPWRWQEVGGESVLGAAVENGKVKFFAPAEFAPIIVLEPAPWNRNVGWIIPAFLVAFGVIVLTAFAWPIVAITRWRYARRSPLEGRALLLHRVTRITAWLMLVVAAGWTAIITSITADAGVLDGRLDIWMRLLQLISIAAVVGALASAWNVWLVMRDPSRKWTARIWAVAIMLSALYLAWLIVSQNTITATLNY